MGLDGSGFSPIDKGCSLANMLLQKSSAKSILSDIDIIPFDVFYYNKTVKLLFIFFINGLCYLMLILVNNELK